MVPALVPVGVLAYGEGAPGAHFAVLAAGAVDAPLLHGAAAVDVLVDEALAEKQAHAQQGDGQGQQGQSDEQGD